VLSKAFAISAGPAAPAGPEAWREVSAADATPGYSGLVRGRALGRQMAPVTLGGQSQYWRLGGRSR